MSIDPKRYIASAPEAQRASLTELDELIRSTFPEARLDPKCYFPVYVVDGDWIAGYATRKKGAMFYLMDPEMLDEHAERLGKQRSGRGCIEYRSTSAMTLEEVRSAARELLAEKRRRMFGASSG